MANQTTGLDIGVNVQDGVTLPLKSIESSIIRFVGAVTAAMAAFKVAMYEVTAASDLQKELLNVQKTTDFADSTIREFSKSLVQMSKQVNVSAVDLAKIASIGGQLGLGAQGSEALAQFTISTARFSSVLDVAVEDAGNGIAKITNIFDIAIRDAERVSSAFNELSNNSTASGADLIDVVQRLGDAGGTIDLTQSLGLAATGRDLGLSLETIGTSFVKVFADMQSKAEDFGKFVGVSTKDWAEIVEKDGVGALKMYLDALRELRSDERARAIEQLSGGGRIFSLVNKLANDTSNDILNKNLQSATDGWISGTSAILEQATVLKGFSAQVQILKNDFDALAIGVGDRTLPALTGLVILFQEWLSDPEVIAGITTIADQLSALAVATADAVRWVASLGVNWSNVVPFLLIVAGLKLSKIIFDWTASTKLFGTALGGLVASATAVEAVFLRLDAVQQRLAKSGRELSLAQQAAFVTKNIGRDVAAPVKSFSPKDSFASFTNTEADLASVRAYEKAKAALVTATAEQTRAQAAKTAAEMAAINAEDALANEKANMRKIVSDIRRTEIGLLEDKKLAAGRALTRVTDDIEHRRSTALRQFEMQRLAAVSAGIDAEEAARINAKYAEYAATVTAFYNKQIAAAEAASNAQIALAEKTAAATIAAQNSAALKPVLAASAANTGARNDLGRLDTDLQEANATAAAAADAADVAHVGRLRRYTNIAAGIIRGLGRVIALALNAFVWVTLIASILEMTGALKWLTDGFFKLLEATGLTSKAQREQNEQNREAIRLSDEKRRAYRAETDEYLQQLRKRGPVTPGKLTEQLGAPKLGVEGTAGVAVDALKDMGRTVIASERTTEQLKETPAVNEKAAASYQALTEKVLQANTALLNLNTALDAQKIRAAKLKDDGANSSGVLNIAAANRRVAATEEEIAKAKLKVAEAIAEQAKAKTKLSSVDEAAQLSQATVAKQSLDLAKQSAGEHKAINSEVVAAMVNGTLTALTKQREAYAKLAEETVDADELGRSKADATSGSEEKKKAAQKEADEAIRMRDAILQQESAKLRALELTYAVELNLIPTSGEKSVVEQLKALSVKELNEAARGMGFVAKEAGYGGEALRNAKDADKPTGTYSGGESASDKRERIAKAEYRKRRMALEAELALQKQARQEELDINEHAYGLGLRSLDEYLESKRLANAAALQGEIALKNDELAELDRQLAKKGLKKTERLGFEGDKFRVEGDLEALNRQAGIDARKARDERIDAERQANDDVLEQQAKFLEEYGSTAEAARIRTERENRLSLNRAYQDRERALAQVSKAPTDDAAKAAWAKVDKADFEIDFITLTINTANFKAEIEQTRKEIEDALSLGEIEPKDAVVSFDVLSERAENGLRPAIEKLREQVKGANAQDLPELSRQLRAAEQAMFNFEQSIREGIGNSIREYMQRLNDGFANGTMAPGAAVTQTFEFKSVVDAASLREIEDLKAQQAKVTEGSADWNRLAGQIAKVKREAAGFAKTLGDIIDSSINLFNAQVDQERALGYYTQAEAGERKVAFARAQSIPLLKEIIQLQGLVSQGIAKPEDTERLRTLTLQYETLNNTISDVANNINGTLKSAFIDFLTTAADGTARMADAWDDYKQTFKTTLTNALATDLTENLFDGLFSGTGSIGDIVSKVLSPKSAVRGQARNSPLYVEDVSQTTKVEGEGEDEDNIFTKIGNFLQGDPNKAPSSDSQGGMGVGSIVDSVANWTGGVFKAVGGFVDQFSGYLGKMFGGGTKEVWSNTSSDGKGEKPLGSSRDRPIFTEVTNLPDGEGEGGDEGGGTEDAASTEEAGSEAVQASSDGGSWWDSLVEKLGQGWDWITDTFSKGWDAFAGAFSKGWDAISGMFSKGWGAISGAFAGIFHEGGVVGAGGGTFRAISPLMFANAPRYHTGGIPGLAPDEVPAVLQKGEEVLTRKDPRHRNNGGLSSVAGGGTLSVNLSDSALNTTMRDWLEIELARVAATR